MQPSELKHKRVGILGSQRSGMGAAALLAGTGAKVLVSDLDPDQFTSAKRERFRELQVEFEFGYHSPDILQSDFVVVSPGIPETAEIMGKLRETGIPIYSEVEVTSWFIDAPIIAVTGSNGKTTTVHLIHHLLRTAGISAWLGGNVGVAISEVYLQSKADPASGKVFVLEISSFQLDHIETFHPQVAVLLNLTPDHLDRYADLDAYYTSKLRIFDNQHAEDAAVLNGEDANILSRYRGKAQKRIFSRITPGYISITRDGMISLESNGQLRPILPRDLLTIPGPHNLSNALAALAAVQDYVADQALLAKGLSTFQAVPHRLEFLGDCRGISFYNDSKATNVDSTRVALESFQQKVWIVLGGKDKGGDFTTLEPLLLEKAAGILLIGDAAPVIAEQLSNDLPIHQLATLDEAVDTAMEKGQVGDILLLSPACASFDQYENYEARGEHFRELYRSHKS